MTQGEVHEMAERLLKLSQRSVEDVARLLLRQQEMEIELLRLNRRIETLEIRCKQAISNDG